MQGVQEDVKESRYNVWVERSGSAYVYNGLSGAVLKVPLDDRRALERLLAGDTRPGCSTELVRDLAVGRMLIADEVDELQLLEARYAYTRHDTSTFGLTIVTSLGCNFDCPYCFEEKHPSILGDDVQRAIIAALDGQLPRINRFDVRWFGGEPLIGKRPLLELSDAFIERCDAAGVAYHADITTNGSLLSAHTCADLRDRRVTSAQVTLDGPPDVHDRMRPMAGGRDEGTFWRIVENLHHAVEAMDVSIRVNVDSGNVDRIGELLEILTQEGFAGRLAVSLGHLVKMTGNPIAPSSAYNGCLPHSEFARVSLEFDRLAARYGFGDTELPTPSGAPCTAVRANELVVGSAGELYKCLDSVGSGHEVIGHITDYEHSNGRLRKWLTYNPFADGECRSCIALPVCMGGCAHHSMDLNIHENRCDEFRYDYRDRVLDYVDSASALTPVAVTLTSSSRNR